MCIKFESEEISITGGYCSKSDSKEEDRGKGTVVCVASRRSDSESNRLSTRRSKTQLQWFRNLCDKHHYHCCSFSFFGRVGVIILAFVLYVIPFHKVYVAMLWRLCIFSKFCKGVYWCYRGTQRKFSENICWEDDLRSRIFRTFVVKFIACLPLLRFSST